MNDPVPFICRHADPRCEDDPCPWGIARVLCNAPSDHPLREPADAERQSKDKSQ